MTLQLFVWAGHGEVQENRIHYNSFTLNDQTYHVGDCVYLYPEDEQFPPYIARILAAFVDRNVQSGADPHCIEVKWFERRVNLEPSTKGIEESEREVFELEDTDINPIGCISGKCRIVKAANYEEAFSRYGNTPGWFFCRGYFQQSSNSFVAYTPEEMAADDIRPSGLSNGLLGVPAAAAAAAVAGGVGPHRQRGPPGSGGQQTTGQQQQSLSDGSARGAAHGQPAVHHELPLPSALADNNGAGGAAAAAADDNVDDGSDDPGPPPRRQQQQQQHNPPPAQQQPASKRQKMTGRTCVECGATSTPQWREGPMGPKTLCNACGVRYVRSQQKAAGQKRTAGGQKNGQGRPQEPNPPRAQQQQQQPQ